MTDHPPLAIIGGGNMATAIVKGLQSLVHPPRITVAEPDAAKRAAFAAQNINATEDNTAATREARIVLLAIKPQVLPQVLPTISAGWASDKLLVSILAGMPTAKIAAGLPAGAKVVRAMPNTPMAIGLGMVGICPGAHAGDADLAMATALFAPSAKILRVSEDKMDAITAVSGSGPAYFFRFAEALHAGAMKLGFTSEEAALLVGTTGTGSWQYLLQSGFEAAKLREQVTSPGGTTAAALSVINAAHFDELWAQALKAAQVRGQELARG
jgi:pyrroline-5-carboxylate reductase